MTHQWEVFPCQLGDHQAFISYDHGLRADIDGLAPGSLLKVKATLNAPREDGLPNSSEFPALTELEEMLAAQFAMHGGVFVGRVTVASLRVFYFYIDIDDAVARDLVARIGADSGYELRYTLRPDGGREGYWQDLFPSKQDWRASRDLKVIEALELAGDALETPRRLDHWAYFADAKSMQKYVDWLQKAGYEIESAREVNPQDVVDTQRPFRVVFHHELAPTLSNVAEVTIKLLDKAAALGGEYDGWEAATVADSAPVS